jgi:hypothetical protein
VGNRRYKNVSDIGEYVRMIGTSGLAEIESESIDHETLIHELVLMQLRLNEGISIRHFIDRTGVDALHDFVRRHRRLFVLGVGEYVFEPGLLRAPVEPLRLLAAVRDAVQRDIEPRAQGGVLSVTARRAKEGGLVTVTGGAGEPRVLALSGRVPV